MASVATAATEGKSAMMKMRMTQSSPHIRLGYWVFSFVHVFHCPQCAPNHTSLVAQQKALKLSIGFTIKTCPH